MVKVEYPTIKHAYMCMLNIIYSMVIHNTYIKIDIINNR